MVNIMNNVTNNISETETLRYHLKVLIDEYLKSDGWKSGISDFGRGYMKGAIDVAEQVNELLENKNLK